MPIDTAIDKTLKRDRMVVIIALGAVVAGSWAFILSGAGMGMSAIEMTRMNLSGDAGMGMTMMTPAIWSPGYVVLMFFMWWVMMIAMMLPSASPMILLFATINRKRREKDGPYVPTVIFVLAYLACWGAFSLVAVMLQLIFQQLTWLSPMLKSNNIVLGGLILVAAGVYQLTPVKQACLRYCQSPIQFLSTRYKDGRAGAFRMGLEHGAYCVGCCWFLMGLLFFGGVMNLYWILGLALFVLIEKLTPPGHWVSYATGILLIGWGGWVLYTLY